MPQEWANGLLHERDGVVYNVSEELAALRSLAATMLNAPSGTRILFQQSTAPVGWTKDTSHNDKALRVVSGTASSGGTTAFSSVFTSRTIARANLPNVTLGGSTGSGGAHTHNISDILRRIEGSAGGGTSGTVANGIFTVDPVTDSSGSHTHTITTDSINGGVAQTAIDFAVQYVDIIFCQKD